MTTETTNYNFKKPDVGSVGWGPHVNQNFDDIDAQLKSGSDALTAEINARSAGDTEATAEAVAASAPRLTVTDVKVSAYTAVANQFIPVDTTAAPVTITLPQAPPAGTRVGIKIVTQSGSNGVTFACSGVDVLNKTGGATTGTMTLLNQSVLLEYTTGIWMVVADSMPLSLLDTRYDAAGAATAAAAASSLRFTVTPVKTAAYTAAANEFVRVDTTSGAVTVTLPTAPAAGTRVGVKLTTQGKSYGVTYACGGSDVLTKAGGPTSGTLSILNQTVVLEYTTGVWVPVSEGTPTSTLDLRYSKQIGKKVAFLGDSITYFGNIAGGYIHYANLRGLQKWRPVVMAGVAGDTAAMMLARFDADIAPSAPEVVFVHAGANDVNNSVALATYVTNMKAIVAKIQALNAVPVLSTIMPVQANVASVNKFNAWLRRYAAEQKLTLVDWYAPVVNTANGQWVSANTADGIHPSELGHSIMGAALASALNPLMPDVPILMPYDNADTNNKLLQGLFLTDTNADGLADNWTSISPTNTTFSLVSGAGDGIPGNWQRMVVASGSGTKWIYQTFTTGFSVGDTLAIVGRARSSSFTGTTRMTAVLDKTGSDRVTTAMPELSIAQPTGGIFYKEVVLPAGTSSLSMFFGISGSGTYSGTFDLAQIGVYNLTTMGVLTP